MIPALTLESSRILPVRETNDYLFENYQTIVNVAASAVTICKIFILRVLDTTFAYSTMLCAPFPHQ